MARLLGGLGLLVVCLSITGPSGAQDTQPARRVRGRLPQYWSRLGLSDQQKKDVFAARTKYQDQIDELMHKVDKLRHDQRVAMEQVLTPGQKARLREIITERAPAEEKATGAATKPTPPVNK